MSYVPAGKVESTKPPVSFVLTSRDSLVSRWVTFTVASGTAAPEESVTLPTIEPKRTCASACRPVNAVNMRPRNAIDKARSKMGFRREQLPRREEFNRCFDMDYPFFRSRISTFQQPALQALPYPCRHYTAVLACRQDNFVKVNAVSRHCRGGNRSEEHTSELQSLRHLVCRLLLE